MGIDEREAFCIAVKIYRSGEWIPGLPNRNKIDINGDPLTLRDICALVAATKDRLPDSIVDDLREHMDDQYVHLRGELAQDRSYAIGAKCLIELMNEREADLRRREWASQSLT